MTKMWGGRFSGMESRLMENFNASIAVDGRMYRQDIMGSIAHARMLARQGIISAEEGELILRGLEEIAADLAAGRLEFNVANEDVHMNIEVFLTERIGEVGKKLHTARSRNDQVALDVRLYLRDESAVIAELLRELLATLLELAGQHTDSLMPGYTHLQKAQPVSLAHHLMAWFEMLRRDYERLQDLLKRVAMMPLGSGALAATGFPLDRQMVAAELGFPELTRNSLDAVSDRDFAIEFCSFASILMMHLSRWSEEIILWSSDEFGFIELDDAYSTGSSIMPQKKNPDPAELIRGKTGRVYGDLIALLTLMKGLPLAYNKDMQEDKEALFDAIDTVQQCLLIMSPLLLTARFDTERMARALRGGFSNATDLADYLAACGLPFRDAHAVVGRAVLHCIERGLALEEMPLATLQEFSGLIGEDIFEVLKVENCLDRRKLPGGPAPSSVRTAIDQARGWLATCQ